MKRNLDSAAQYKNAKQIDGSLPPPTFAMLGDRDENKSRKPQTPYVPTMAELVQQYERDTAAVKSLASADFEDRSFTR